MKGPGCHEELPTDDFEALLLLLSRHVRADQVKKSRIRSAVLCSDAVIGFLRGQICSGFVLKKLYFIIH